MFECGAYGRMFEKLANNICVQGFAGVLVESLGIKAPGVAATFGRPHTQLPHTLLAEGLVQ